MCIRFSLSNHHVLNQHCSHSTGKCCLYFLIWGIGNPEVLKCFIRSFSRILYFKYITRSLPCKGRFFISTVLFHNLIKFSILLLIWILIASFLIFTKTYFLSIWPNTYRVVVTSTCISMDVPWQYFERERSLFFRICVSAQSFYRPCIYNVNTFFNCMFYNNY